MNEFLDDIGFCETVLQFAQDEIALLEERG
jgi:hypothetical protein